MLNLETLPEDILVLILSQTYHLTVLSHVSKKFKQLSQADRLWKQRFQLDFSKPVRQQLRLSLKQTLSKEMYQAFLSARLVAQEQEILRLLHLAYDHHPFEPFFETPIPHDQLFLRAYGCFAFERDAPSSFHDVFVKIIENDLSFIKDGLKKLVQGSQKKIEDLEAGYALYSQREFELNRLNAFIFDKILTYSLNVIEGKAFEVGQTRRSRRNSRPGKEPGQPRKRVLAKGLLTRVTEQSIERLWNKIPDIRSLDLSFNGLSFIPENINLLSYLKTLRLAHNHLIFIPATLPPLRRLDLTSNYFFNLPHVILHLTTIEELYFGNFAPSGRECVGCNYSDSGRKTSGNQLSVLPPEITRLKKLRLLSLNSVGLTQISPDLLQLPELKMALLFHNEIQVLPPGLLASNQIQWRLEGNPIRDEPSRFPFPFRNLVTFMRQKLASWTKTPEDFLIQTGNEIFNQPEQFLQRNKIKVMALAILLQFFEYKDDKPVLKVQYLEVALAWGIYSFSGTLSKLLDHSLSLRHFGWFAPTKSHKNKAERPFQSCFRPHL